VALIEGIPEESVTVITGNSIYAFGPADESGKRAVTKDGNPLVATLDDGRRLTISECRILVLCEGEKMEITSADDPKFSCKWTTTRVKSIATSAKQGV
jgi:hypothetical protein